MRRVWVCAVVLAVLVALPGVATENEVQPIIAGDIAPVSGLLVEEARFTKFLEAEASVKELGQRLAIQVKYSDAAEKFYRAEIARASTREWWEDPSLNRWVGFGIGIVATSLAVWGATKVTASQ